MAGEIGLFDILDRRGRRGAFPLNENHWSNVLYWILDPMSGAGLSTDLLNRLADNIGITPPTETPRAIEREAPHTVGLRRRFIDVEIEFPSGVRWLFEIKVDPAYQDREQVVDETGLLGPDDRLLLIAPHDLRSFVAASLGDHHARSRVHCLSWKSVAEICESLADDGGQRQSLATIMMQGISIYWRSRPTESFEQMVLTIAHEQGWSSFYPDDFRDVFGKRYPETWAQWVVQRGESGKGNAKWHLTTLLSGLARNHRCQIELTGEERAPNDPKWGFSPIYEYRVIQD